MKSITARGANYLKKNEFPLLVRRSHGAPSRSSKNAPTHTHDFSELVVISKGRTLQSIDGCKIPIGTGDVFFFHGNQSPFFHGHQYLESLNVLFDPHALKLPEEELRSIPGYCTLLKIDCDHNMDPQFPHHLHLSVPQLLAVESMIAQIHDEILQTPPGYQPLLRSKLVELLIYLSRACKEPETTGNKNTHQANKIISILEKKFYQPWTLDELALLAGMSKSNLLTTFRQATSQTPIERWVSMTVTISPENSER